MTHQPQPIHPEEDPPTNHKETAAVATMTAKTAPPPWECQERRERHWEATRMAGKAWTTRTTRQQRETTRTTRTTDKEQQRGGAGQTTGTTTQAQKVGATNELGGTGPHHTRNGPKMTSCRFGPQASFFICFLFFSSFN
jgi:hypothetical protein